MPIRREASARIRPGLAWMARSSSEARVDNLFTLDPVVLSFARFQSLLSSGDRSRLQAGAPGHRTWTPACRADRPGGIRIRLRHRRNAADRAAAADLGRAVGKRGPGRAAAH